MPADLTSANTIAQLRYRVNTHEADRAANSYLVATYATNNYVNSSTFARVLEAQTWEANNNFRSQVHLSGIITDTLAATANNYAPTGHSNSNVWRISSSNNFNITGIDSNANGRVLIIHNIGSNLITFSDESGFSNPVNRFSLNDDFDLNPDSTVLIQYDGVSQRWRMLGSSVVAGSSGFDVSNTEPTPTQGKAWYDLESGGSFVYVNDGDSAQWVEIGGGGAGNSLTPIVGANVEIFMSPTGSDTLGDGSESNPYRSFVKVKTEAVKYDGVHKDSNNFVICRLLDGTYTESTRWRLPTMKNAGFGIIGNTAFANNVHVDFTTTGLGYVGNIYRTAWEGDTPKWHDYRGFKITSASGYQFQFLSGMHVFGQMNFGLSSNTGSSPHHKSGYIHGANHQTNVYLDDHCWFSGNTHSAFNFTAGARGEAYASITLVDNPRYWALIKAEQASVLWYPDYAGITGSFIAEFPVYTYAGGTFIDHWYYNWAGNLLTHANTGTIPAHLGGGTVNIPAPAMDGGCIEDIQDGGYVRLTSGSANSVGRLVVDLGEFSGYRHFKLILSDLCWHANGGSGMQVRCSTDRGTTFDSNNGRYYFNWSVMEHSVTYSQGGWNTSVGAGGAAGNTGIFMPLWGGTNNHKTYVSMELDGFNCEMTNTYKPNVKIETQAMAGFQSGDAYSSWTSAGYGNTSGLTHKVDAIEIKNSGGGPWSTRYALLGVRTNWYSKP